MKAKTSEVELASQVDATTTTTTGADEERLTRTAAPRDRLRSTLEFLAVHLYTQLVLCPAHIVFGLVTGRMNPFAVTKHICDALGVRFRKTRGSRPLCPAATARVIYLCNHRSWADFFCDQVITGGASYLSRYMVILATPVSSLYAFMSHSTWFFNRKRGIDRAAFAKFMDDEWNKRPQYGMIACAFAPPLTRAHGARRTAH